MHVYHRTKIKYFNDLNEIKAYNISPTKSCNKTGILSGYSIALGNFDGVHLGHQKVIAECRQIATQNNWLSVVLTFSPHPLTLTNPGSTKNKKIYHQEYNLKLLSETGIDEIWVLNFNQELLTVNAQDFIFSLLTAKMRHLTTGYNFYFGHKRSGNTELLHKMASELGFGYSEIEQFVYNYHTVSSSYIKNILQLGVVQTASNLLGRPYLMSGLVQKGQGIAKSKLGIPTANITNPRVGWKFQDNINDTTVLAHNNKIQYPAYGVYLAYTYFENSQYWSIINFGIRPTVDGNNQNTMPTLEVHLLDYTNNQSLLDKQLTVAFLQFIRPEIKFNSLEQLKNQINRDVSLANYIKINWHKSKAVSPILY